MRTSLASFDRSGRYNVAAKCKYIYNSDAKTKVWLEDDSGNVIPVQAQDVTRWEQGQHYWVYELGITREDGERTGQVDERTTVTSLPDTQFAIVGSLSGEPVDRWDDPLPMVDMIQAHFEQMSPQVSADISQAVIHTGTISEDCDLLRRGFESLTEAGIRIYHVPANSSASSNNTSIDGIERLTADTVNCGGLTISGWAPHTGTQCPEPNTDSDVFVIGKTPLCAQYSPAIEEVLSEIPCTPDFVVFRGQGSAHARQEHDSMVLFTADLNRWHPESVTGWYVTSHADNQLRRNVTHPQTPSYEQIAMSELEAPDSTGADRLQTILQNGDAAVIDSDHSIYPRDFRHQINSAAEYSYIISVKY